MVEPFWDGIRNKKGKKKSSAPQREKKYGVRTEGTHISFVKRIISKM